MHFLFFLVPYLLVLIASFLSSPTYTYAQQDQQISIPRITPYWIKRAEYAVEESLVLSKAHGQTTSDSIFSPKSLLTSIPSAIGGLAIVTGSLIAWFRVQGRGKTFKKYLAAIDIAQKVYLENKGNDKKKAKKELQETFEKMETDIDLASANKKIDDSQRTTLDHTIERIVSENKS